LCGYLKRTSGNIKILGKSPKDSLVNIGILTQKFSLYPNLTVSENLNYFAGLREIPDSIFISQSQKYLQLVGLNKFRNRLAQELSGGMKQKLALCCALISQPKVLLLDEPTTGVDAVSRRELWDILSNLSLDGITIIVATPDLDDAERCNRFAFMHQGKIHDICSPTQMKKQFDLERLVVYTSQLVEAEKVLSAIRMPDNALEISDSTLVLASTSKSIVDVQIFGDRLDILVLESQLGELEIRELFIQKQILFTSIEIASPTLENIIVTKLRKYQSLPSDMECTYSVSSKPDELAIFADRLSRSYDNFVAVRNVSISIKYGEIYGLIGANGAGKTTTIKMLCGLISKSSGYISLGGENKDLRSIRLRKRIGYMSQKFTLYDDLTILQNLEFYAGVYGLSKGIMKEKINWVMSICGLRAQENMLMSELSGGVKQRVAFGASVLHEPDILFLDEPTSGVDPLARRQFWRLINTFASNGTAILLTTHYLEEAEQCNRLSILVSGETVIEGSPSQIKSSQSGQIFKIIVDQTKLATNLLKHFMEPWRVSIFSDSLHVNIDELTIGISKIQSLLKQENISVLSLSKIPYSLEDVFIKMVQNNTPDRISE
jgi:ABC-2 type transport system ATP-binding protein